MDLSEQHFQLVSSRTLINCATQYTAFLKLLDEEGMRHTISGVTEVVEQLQAIENELQRRGIDPARVMKNGSV